MYRDLGLVVNTNKTEVMYQLSGERPLVDSVMKIDEAELRTVTQSTYLGSTYLQNAQLTQKSTKGSTRPPFLSLK